MEAADAFNRYMDHYRIRVPQGGSAYWDRTGSGGETAIFVYAPAHPVKTVILVHGYITHSGSGTFLIDHLLSLGYRVVCADLPGHGLSAGAMCDIDDFSAYGKFVADLVAYCEVRWSGEIDYVAHSTGCSAGIEYLRQGGSGIARMAFINPLIRSYLWDLSQKSMSVTERFSETFPSLRSDATKDRVFNEIIENDPLRNSLFPYHWVRELDEWNDRLAQDSAMFDIPILTLQGAKDTVVDAEYGEAYLRRTFTNLEYVRIKRGIHNMHCDKPAIRNGIYERVSDFLDE
jgi:alpha-beta hydrolase superfamily lysophospholipase